MLRFVLSNKWEQKELDHPGGPIEFGRGPQRDNVRRYVIRDDLCVSRDHVRVEELEAGKVRVRNLSTRNPILLFGTNTIPPGQSQELGLPVRLGVGETYIDVSVQEVFPPGTMHTLGPRARRVLEGGMQTLSGLGSAPTPEKLTEWLETVIAVQRLAAGSQEFFDQTAQAVVQQVGLDRGLVLIRRNGLWEVVARASRDAKAGGRDFSSTILNNMMRDRQTTFLSAAAVASTVDSLQGIEAVVAAPVFDEKDQVVGAVYGARVCGFALRHHGINTLEAHVMQLLAAIVGSALIRQDREAEVSRLRIQFDQFFSPKLARELETNPQLLEGKRRNVTVLLTDIRGFSRLAQHLGPEETCRVVSDTLDRLTARVKEHDGVVVDFAGDGMLAMWNAPTEQTDHADRACRAALAMVRDLPDLTERWKAQLPGGLSLGIGINTGEALVGNVGSRLKVKYGPFGHTVNLASRVEGATKHLGVPILVTRATKEALKSGFALRRLRQVKLLGMDGVHELFELHAEEDAASSEWTGRCTAYERALELFEAGNWAGTCKALQGTLSGVAGDYDLPSLELIAHAVECLKHPPDQFSPVLDMRSK